MRTIKKYFLQILLIGSLINLNFAVAQDKKKFELGLQYSSNFGQTGFVNHGGNLQLLFSKDRNIWFGIQSFGSLTPTSVRYQMSDPFVSETTFLSEKKSKIVQQYHGLIVQYRLNPFFFLNINFIAGINYGGIGNIGLIDKIEPNPDPSPLGNYTEGNEINHPLNNAGFNKINSFFSSYKQVAPMLGLALDWRLGRGFAFRFQITNYDITKTQKKSESISNNFEIIVDDKKNLVSYSYEKASYIPVEFSAGILFKMGKKKY